MCTSRVGQTDLPLVSRGINQTTIPACPDKPCIGHSGSYHLYQFLLKHVLTTSFYPFSLNKASLFLYVSPFLFTMRLILFNWALFFHFFYNKFVPLTGYRSVSIISIVNNQPLFKQSS